jgi:serine/threonine protein kinase
MHWEIYDEKQDYSYGLMEYCSGGDLANEISKRIEEKKKLLSRFFC